MREVFVIKILTHICCGPCCVAFAGGLAQGGFTPVLLWHNPNIHPFTEYRDRKNGAIEVAAKNNLQLIIPDDEKYGLCPFLDAVWGDIDDRCRKCYYMRLEYAAKYAAAHGFDAFSTTLLASPYQDFDAVCRIGAEVGAAVGIDFIVNDSRAQYRAGVVTAHGEGIYIQKYCGCIFSEEERYTK